MFTVSGNEKAKRLSFIRVNIGEQLSHNCSYTKECRKDLAVNIDLCSYCIYRTKLDIPHIIEEQLKNKV